MEHVMSNISQSVEVEAKCVPGEPDIICIGSLTINLGKDSATVSHDGIKSKTLVPPKETERGTDPWK